MLRYADQRSLKQVLRGAIVISDGLSNVLTDNVMQVLRWKHEGETSRPFRNCDRQTDQPTRAHWEITLPIYLQSEVELTNIKGGLNTDI